jgi:hypothetical protein
VDLAVADRQERRPERAVVVDAEVEVVAVRARLPFVTRQTASAAAVMSVSTPVVWKNTSSDTDASLPAG